MNRRTRWMLVAVFAAFLVGLPSLASAAGSVFDFDSAEYSVGENDGSVTIHVLRSGSLAGAATVDYHTSDGTATAGEDYTATSGTLTWADGQGGDMTFAVAITPNPPVDGDETVELTLDNPTGGAVGATGTAELTIQDDRITYQPDLLVKGPGRASYIGDNVYNTLVGQTSSTRVKKGRSKTFYVKFQNDGNDSDRFGIRGKHGTTTFSVQYFHGTKNISRTIIAGAGQTPVLAPGATWIMKVVIAPKRAARAGNTYSDVISGQSQSDATKGDRVQLNAKVAAS